MKRRMDLFDQQSIKDNLEDFKLFCLGNDHKGLVSDKSNDQIIRDLKSLVAQDGAGVVEWDE